MDQVSLPSSKEEALLNTNLPALPQLIPNNWTQIIARLGLNEFEQGKNASTKISTQLSGSIYRRVNSCVSDSGFSCDNKPSFDSWSQFKK